METKTDVFTNINQIANPKLECLDSSSKHYQNVLDAGFENYTQFNCILTHLQRFFPHCSIINVNGYNSSEKKGLFYVPYQEFLWELDNTALAKPT